MLQLSLNTSHVLPTTNCFSKPMPFHSLSCGLHSFNFVKTPGNAPEDVVGSTFIKDQVPCCTHDDRLRRHTIDQQYKNIRINLISDQGIPSIRPDQPLWSHDWYQLSHWIHLTHATTLSLLTQATHCPIIKRIRVHDRPFGAWWYGCQDAYRQILSHHRVVAGQA